MLAAVQPAIAKLQQQPGRAKALLAGLVFVLSLVVFLVRAGLRKFLPFTGDRKQVKKDRSSSSRSSGDKRSSSSSLSSSSRKHKSGSSSSRHHRHDSKRPNSSLPTMLVLVGVHGSGKSSWARQYVEKVRKSSIVVCSDTIRAALTGSIDDYSREEEVGDKLLSEVSHHVQLRRTVIVDDCQHNLSPTFRAKLLALAPEGEYNRVLRRFPIKAIFAQSRIDKDIAEGKKRYHPSPLELEGLIAKFDAVEDAIKDDGWLEEK